MQRQHRSAVWRPHEGVSALWPEPVQSPLRPNGPVLAAGVGERGDGTTGLRSERTVHHQDPRFFLPGGLLCEFDYPGPACPSPTIGSISG